MQNSVSSKQVAGASEKGRMLLTSATSRERAEDLKYHFKGSLLELLRRRMHRWISTSSVPAAHRWAGRVRYW